MVAKLLMSILCSKTDHEAAKQCMRLSQIELMLHAGVPLPASHSTSMKLTNDVGN